MANFIAMHNLSFQTADHPSDLLPKMFPDSKIASDFGCKHTKTKSICCDVLDPYYKKPVIQMVQQHLICFVMNLMIKVRLSNSFQSWCIF